MAFFGTWRSPFAGRLGGGGSDLFSRIYEAIISNVGTGFSHEFSAINSADDIAAARLIGKAERALERWIAQADPQKLTSLLERWEQFLGVVPPQSATQGDRRSRVAGILSGAPGNNESSLQTSLLAAIYPWDCRLNFIDAASATMHWSGTAEPTEWSSTTAFVNCEIYWPLSAPIEELQKRIDAAHRVLDERLPAWADFDITYTVAP